jgi:hypothetical protein
MSPNLAAWDRTLRYIVGILLTTWLVAGGPTWTLIGLFLLATASFGTCPVYWYLRLKSNR